MHISYVYMYAFIYDIKLSFILIFQYSCILYIGTDVRNHIKVIRV